MNKELIRLLREIEEVSGKLYSNTSQGKDLRVYKGTKRQRKGHPRKKPRRYCEEKG